MFHLGRDDMALGGVRPQRRCDGGIVALCRERGKNHIARGRSNQICSLFAGCFDHRLEFRPELVGAGRVAPFRRKVRHHGFQHFRQNGRGRVVVEVITGTVYSSQKKIT